MVVECVEPGCLFTKILLCQKSTWRWQKQTKHAFSLLKKMNFVPKNNCYLRSHFNRANKEGKISVWKTRYKRILEMCIVQHVEMKSVFTFEPIKRLVSMTVQSTKPAATFWILLLRTKNRQLCCLAVTVHIVLQERRVATTKKKNQLRFWRNFCGNQFPANPNTRQNWLKWV